MLNFFKKIFSISEESEKRLLIQILGIKIKTPKPYYAKLRKKNIYYYYKKNNIDITTLPKAEGKLRDIQLATLGILKIFDKLCSENKLTYWLFAGSALGQIRHNGFIPWDDDIDIAMPREDYNRVLELINNQNDLCIKAELYNTSHQNGFIIKIKHKYSEKLFIDIFAVDFTGKNYSIKDQFIYTKEIKNERKKLTNNNITKKSLLNELLELKNKYIDYNASSINSDLLIGVEWEHSEPNWFLRYDTVYPIKEVDFDGFIAKSMNNPKQYCKDYYGNYMAYPSKLNLGHSMYEKFEDKDLLAIEELKRKL